MAIPIELQDVTRVLSQLVMPSPRRAPNASPGPNHSMKHLAPIEMAAHSIHMHQPYHNLVPPPSTGPAVGMHVFNHNNNSSSSVSISVSSAGSDNIFPSLQQQSASQGPPASFGLYSSSCATSRSTISFSGQIQGWLIPVGYMICGLGMGLCNLIAPVHIPACAHLLCPLWTLSLGLHAATETDPMWSWTAFMCIFLLPFVILVRDFLFVAFYLLVFTAFTSGRFWQTFQGPMFILLCLCCGGLVVCCILSLTSDHPAYQISVAGFFSLTASIISSSRLGKIAFRIG
jgi:hypothetical protein